jgi:Tfp pilus assembly protein PilV
MRIVSTHRPASTTGAGFTLVEVLIAGFITCILMGGVMALLIQSLKEQRLSLACATVESKSAVLQAAICSCLRSNNSMKTDGWSEVDDVNGNTLGFQGVTLFATSAGNASAEIYFDPTHGAVIYTNIASGGSSLWWTNSATATLSQLLFVPESKPNTAPNYTLVNVRMEINDNRFSSNFSIQNTTNSLNSTSVSFSNGAASLYRSFAIQMMGDYTAPSFP